MLLLEADPLIRSANWTVTKPEFGRRAAEMEARNLAQPRFLLDCTQAGLRISVSADLLLRGIRACDAAVLRAAAERVWLLKISEGVVLRIMISSEPLELAVTEKTEPMVEVNIRPGERRPRRPMAVLAVGLTAGYRNVMVSDKRGTRIESKLRALFVNAEALAAEVHGEH